MSFVSFGAVAFYAIYIPVMSFATFGVAFCAIYWWYRFLFFGVLVVCAIYIPLVSFCTFGVVAFGAIKQVLSNLNRIPLVLY